MANPGLSTTIDVDALTAIIVFANNYKTVVENNSDQIRAICANMESNESLKGGDGEIIRENFASLSKGCVNLKRSMEAVSKVLNEKLEVAIKMRHGKSVGDSTDKAKQAVSGMGVLKKE